MGERIRKKKKGWEEKGGGGFREAKQKSPLPKDVQEGVTPHKITTPKKKKKKQTH